MAVDLIETKAAFARRLNVSPGYVSNLIRKGMPVSSEGQVRVDPALKWIRENLHAKPGRPAGAVEGGGEIDDLTLAKVRLTLAQAAKAEMDLAVRRGELIPVDIVKRGNFTFFRQARDHALNFPLRCGAQLAADFGISPAEFAPVLERMLIEHLMTIDQTILPFREETAAEAAGHCPHCLVDLNRPRCEGIN
jgi:phage terminase Nu1 subunit (DNA packaging protein)